MVAFTLIPVVSGLIVVVVVVHDFVRVVVPEAIGITVRSLRRSGDNRYRPLDDSATCAPAQDPSVLARL